METCKRPKKETFWTKKMEMTRNQMFCISDFNKEKQCSEQEKIQWSSPSTRSSRCLVEGKYCDCWEHFVFHAAPQPSVFRQRWDLLLFPFGRDIATEARGQAPFFTRWFYFELHFLLVRIMYNSMPHEALFHCKCLATASVFTLKWALFLMERENMALEIKHSCVGSTTAFSWALTHMPFWGMSFHVLLQVIFAFKCFLAYFTWYFLFVGLSPVF